MVRTACDSPDLNPGADSAKEKKFNMKYSIIIPTYNHCTDLLIPCVESILKYSNIQDIELIISANGCTDNTRDFLNSLQDYFKFYKCPDGLKVVWHDQALGYSRALNAGIKVSTTNNILLLNNDTVLLPQNTNDWLFLLEHEFVKDPQCGISGVHGLMSPFTNRMFVIFFCVLIKREVFDRLGLLNEAYGTGGGEDTEFCYEAEKLGYNVKIIGNTYYPIYHEGEGTMHDGEMTNEDLENLRIQNEARMAKKYNIEWYNQHFSHVHVSDE